MSPEQLWARRFWQIVGVIVAIIALLWIGGRMATPHPDPCAVDYNSRACVVDQQRQDNQP
jgi:hypothetical protein